MISTKIVRYVLIFVLGSVSFYFIDKMRAGIPSPSRQFSIPTQVKLNKILPEDSWISKYQVQVVPLNEVESNREYLLLILKPETMSTDIEYPDKHSRFVLTGLKESDAWLEFVIDPSGIKKSPGPFYTLLLDFGGRLWPGQRIRLSDGLELQSWTPELSISLQKKSRGNSN
jgi:hypothetical protein